MMQRKKTDDLARRAVERLRQPERQQRVYVFAQSPRDPNYYTTEDGQVMTAEAVERFAARRPHALCIYINHQSHGDNPTSSAPPAASDEGTARRSHGYG